MASRVNSATTTEHALITKLQGLLPRVTFKSGDVFAWSAEHATVTYCRDLEKEKSTWALLHEAGHAVLNHHTYSDDIDLLHKEVEAWQKAKDIGAEYNIAIDADHVEDCLDTYRDWMHQRATCPDCATISLQASPQTYRCHNCSTIWNVSASRLCRSYRASQAKKPPESTSDGF